MNTSSRVEYSQYTDGSVQYIECYVSGVRVLEINPPTGALQTSDLDDYSSGFITGSYITEWNSLISSRMTTLNTTLSGAIAMQSASKT